jgi:hypothetical protein
MSMVVYTLIACLFLNVLTYLDRKYPANEMYAGVWVRETRWFATRLAFWGLSIFISLQVICLLCTAKG